MDFGIVVVDPEREADSQARTPGAAAVAWSGWIRVVPGDRQTITALLATQEEQGRSGQHPLTLKLITKMAEGDDNSFAWARFADVTIEYR